jgi:hypothetical protein
MPRERGEPGGGCPQGRILGWHNDHSHPEPCWGLGRGQFSCRECCALPAALESADQLCDDPSAYRTGGRIAGRPNLPDPQRLRIRCGHCPRTYTTVTEHNYRSLPRARPPQRIVRAAPMRVPELSPEVWGWFRPGTRILETQPGFGGRLKFSCHPTKCGKERVITFDRWTRGVEAVFRAGRDELMIGGPGGL